MKHGPKTASRDRRIGGTIGLAVADFVRFCIIESVEPSYPCRASVPDRRRSPSLPATSNRGFGYGSPRWTTRSFNVSNASDAPGKPCARNANTVAIRFSVLNRARWSHACVRPDLTTASKYSTGRSGGTNGLRLVHLAAPSCRSMKRRDPPLVKVSSGS